jgi:hypothetical protein
MNALRKSLLAVTAVFSLSPATVFALPSPQCDKICPYYPAACVEECYEGLVATTCGEAGYWCIEADAPDTSVTDASVQRADEAPTCSVEHPAEVQPATGES